MSATLATTTERRFTRKPEPSVPRNTAETKKGTKPVRLPDDVAQMLDELAPLFGRSVPEFAGDLLRPALQVKLQEASDMLLAKRNALKAKR